MADTLWMAMERRRIEPTAMLTEAICLSCRYEGDVDLASRVLDKALLHFLERNTFAPQLKPGELAARIWYQAIWVSAYWPRQPKPLQQPSPLMPPDDDHYADGLYLRATGDFETAVRAFSAEMDEPGSTRPVQRQRPAPGRRGTRRSHRRLLPGGRPDRADPDPRYYPGDVEWHIAEIILTAAADLSYPTALEYARRSYAARRSSDAVGRASSRVLEARIRLALLAPGDPIEEGLPPPDDPVVLEEIDGLLSEAIAEGGGRSAENRAHGLMVRSSIMLGRGDLTSAVAAFEESVSLLVALQEADLWRYNLRFAHNLIHHGWIARGYEVAVAAFHFAMQTGDPMLPTRIRRFCQHLETTYPELTT